MSANGNMIYGIEDKPKTVRELLLYAVQILLSVFVATVLIAAICGTPIDACLVGACFGTLIYEVFTKFKSPMFISSCGATVSAVIGALAIGDGNNYLAVVIGGVVIAVIYSLFALLVKLKGVESINKIFPAIIVGPVTMVIGLNLATFIPTYVQVEGQYSTVGILIAIFTMFVIAVSSHYFKGFMRTIPFLIGLGAGYALSALLTVCGVANIIDFSKFSGIGVFRLPDFSFLHFNTSLDWTTVGQVVLLFVPVAICALLEHYSDHKVMSGIVGTDLTVNPGLHRTLVGDGIASFFGTVICGLPNTSYGESIATVGFSRVASVKVISTAAIMLGIMGFIEPVQVFINSIPACVFGGCAMILYGYIASSGLKTLIASKSDLNNNKNLIIVSVILTVGVSGIWLFSQSFAGVSLAMVLGVILNLVLKGGEKSERP